MDIDTFYSLRFNSSKFDRLVETIKPPLKNLLTLEPYDYEIINRLIGTKVEQFSYLTSISIKTSFIATINAGCSMPWHTDGGPRLSLNIPIKNCQKLVAYHSKDEFPLNPTKIDRVSHLGKDYSFLQAENFSPKTLVETDAASPFIFNIRKFHTASNYLEVETSVILTLRFSFDDEQKIFDICNT